MRTSMRWSSGNAALRSARPRCSDTAHSTASTTLANSASRPSPISLKMRPWCFSISGSNSSLRPAFRRVKGPRLVALHERRVADHVGGEDRRELAFHGRPLPGNIRLTRLYTVRGEEAEMRNHRDKPSLILLHARS